MQGRNWKLNLGLLAMWAGSVALSGCGPLGAQPAAEAPAVGRNAGPVVAAYRLAADDLARRATELQARYAGHEHVRIASDTRSGQLLVVAPPEVQQQISQILAVSPVAPSPALSAQETPEPTENPDGKPADAPASMRQVYQLRQASWRELEKSLQAFPRIATFQETQRNGEVAVFRVRARDNATSWLFVDRRVDQIILEGAPAAVTPWMALLKALDHRQPAANEETGIVSLERSEPRAVRKILTVFEQQQADAKKADANTAAADPTKRAIVRPVANQELLAQAPADGGPNNQGQPEDEEEEVEQIVPTDLLPGDAAALDDAGLIGPVQIEFVEGLGVIVVRGNKRDVERVTAIINEIEQISGDASPVIEVLAIQHVDSITLMMLIGQVYEQVPSLRQTRVTMTPLGKPNAVLLIGRPEGVKTMTDLIARLDQPVDPETQSKVFYLKYSAASAAQTTIQEFFADRPGLGAQARVTADVRTNSLLVQASPRDLQEVALMIERIDRPTSEAVNELRVFPLQNSLATELAPILQQAILNQGAGATGTPTTPTGLPQPAAQPGTAGAQTKSTMLRFMTIDAEGQRQIKSGILSDVKITADPRGNTIVISAPAESMDLLAALVKQLDQMPAAEAQIKVFTIVNGDAASLMQMLETLFGISGTGTGQGFGQNLPGFLQGGNLAMFQTAAGNEGSLVQLRFSVDQRTNSIVASGAAADLGVVEAILLRLDDSDVRQRESTVYRLKNAPAIDVATAINEFLRSERQVQQVVPGLVSPFEQIEREVVVVPETVSNSLIVSATPRYFEEIRKIVEQLDARPPLVVIQVMLAEVTMSNTDEFGVELGLQNSVLFDRSIVETVTGGSGSLVPGFNFNNQPLGNSASPESLATADKVGGQGLTSFSLGRINNDLGFGGLVLSASSESLSVLLRALNESRRVEVLARPQVTTLDNQPAFIQVGQRVPRVTNTNLTQVGQQNTVTLENVGLILGVTPRISPDGLVVMEIDAERSELSPEPGVPISIAENGDVLRSPIVNTTTAQTTVSALSGQTIVLGGLITKNKSQIHRRVPVLSEIPILGNAFRYDFVTTRRSELLIIMTPRVVRGEEDADIIKQVESSRMSWCLADVVKLHGPSGIRSRSSEWTDGEVPTIYPDLMPQGLILDEPVFEEVPALPPTEVLPELVPQDAVEPTPKLPPPVETPVLPPPESQSASGRHDYRTARRPTPSAVQPATPPEMPGNSARPAVAPAGEGQEAPKQDSQVKPAAYQQPPVHSRYPAAQRVVDPRDAKSALWR